MRRTARRSLKSAFVDVPVLFHGCRLTSQDAWPCCRAEPRPIVAGKIARRRRQVNAAAHHTRSPRTERPKNSCHIASLAAQWLASLGRAMAPRAAKKLSRTFNEGSNSVGSGGACARGFGRAAAPIRDASRWERFQFIRSAKDGALEIRRLR